jgi:hypothetical protein
MPEEYADYKKSEPRTLTIADFPEPITRYSAASLHYFKTHFITPKPMPATVYPVHAGICYVMTGPCLCFQIRLTGGAPVARFWSPPGSPLGRVLFQPDPLLPQKYVFVVEGLTDALALYQLRQPVVALIGAKVSEEQFTLLRELSETKTLVLLPDNDEEGEKCALAVQRELTCVVRHLPWRYKDVCDMPIPERNRFLKAAEEDVC